MAIERKRITRGALSLASEELTNKLLSILPWGKENAVHQYELADSLGVSADVLKGIIKRARRDEQPILSGNSGYWLSDNPEEIREFAHSLKGESFSMMKTAEGLEKAAEREEEAQAIERIRNKHAREENT